MNREEGMRNMEYNKMMRCYSEQDRIREQQQKIYYAIYDRNTRIRQALYFGRNSNDNAYIAKQPSSDKRVRSFMDGFKEIANSIRFGGKEV